MARFSKLEMQESLMMAMASGSAATIKMIRDAIWNCMRSLPSISPCSATMYVVGSDPDSLFDIELLEEGEVGGIVIDGVETGYKVVPLVTGSGVNQVNPTAGISSPSIPFDGSSEISSGSGPTDNMLCINYNGYMDLVASLKPTPQGQQSNREVEIDVIVFDNLGNALRQIGFVASANQSTNGRAFTQNIARVTLSPSFLASGECVALVARKFQGEQNTNVRITKGFLQVTLNGLG